MKRITAIFTGANGSCGYRKDQRYSLIITLTDLGNTLVTGETEGKTVEYSTVIAFLNNWNHITNVK